MVGVKVILEVKKILSFGVILGEKEILLPRQYVPENCEIGDEVEVFIYTDSEDRLIATTLEPYGFLGDIVCLEVVSISDFGVFLDLGIAKDILMPCRNVEKYRRGQRVPVQIGIDKEGRLLANKTFKFQKYRGKPYIVLEVVPYRESPLGFECIVGRKYQGMLFKNEVFKPLQLGEKYQAQIKQTRKDGKIDLKLLQENEADQLLKVLREYGGRIKLTKESPPEEIARVFHMSKKAFKRALNDLAQRVGQDEESIFERKMERLQ